MTTLRPSGADPTEELATGLRRQLAQLDQTQRALAAISCTVVSARKEVSVTVTQGGEVSDVTFAGSAYKRMAPAELSGLVCETVRSAQDAARNQTAEALAPTLPPGFDAHRLLAGGSSLREAVPLTPLVQDLLTGTESVGRG